jgi:hypothetical protein
MQSNLSGESVLGMWRRVLFGLTCFTLCCFVVHRESRTEEAPVVAKSKANHEAMFAAEVRPLLTKYCLGCHSQKEQEGELDLERFTSLNVVRKDVKPWQAMIRQLETREMPPKDKPQPSAEQRKMLIDWTRIGTESGSYWNHRFYLWPLETVRACHHTTPDNGVAARRGHCRRSLEGCRLCDGLRREMASWIGSTVPAE